MGASPKEAVLAAEQKAVDRAYACYEAQLTEMTDGSAAGAAASGKDGVAIRRAAEAKADEYRLDGESLVVMRVDAQGNGDSEPETFYLGRRKVSDIETRDLVVVPWTNKQAVAWRQAPPNAPGEVRLRRRLDCDERTVRDYRDEIAPPAPAGGGVLSAPPAGGAERTPPRTVATPGDVFRDVRPAEAPATDEFLLRELDRSRGGTMRDIVETIQPDQLGLVARSPENVLVIQGGPGTGKSAVGLHRVTWLVDNEHFRAQDILVIGPHRRFLDYVGAVLPTLGTRDITAVELSLLWTGDVRGADSPQTRRIKSDERMADVLRRRVESQCRPEAVDGLLAEPAGGEEPMFTVVLGSAPLRIPRSEITALLDKVRGGPGHYRGRRDRFRDLVADRLLASLAKGFPQRARERNARRNIERHRQVTALVDRTWPALSPEEALRSLLNSRDRLAEHASHLLDPEEQALLHRPAAGSAAEEPWTPDDLVCLEELRLLIAGEAPRRYPHIVVDEAQDLTPMQARSLRRRCPTGSMTVLGDLAQATGPYGYSGWERLGGILAGDGDWGLAELGTSYRVPDRIMDFVAPLARAVAPSVPFPIAVKEGGDDAVRVTPTTPWKLLDDAVAHAASLVGDDGRSQRSIAVVVPDDTDWLDEAEQLVGDAEGLTDEARESISVLTAAQAKGMEFDHVIVLEPSTVVARGPEGPRQLYVALTRSTRTLTVLHTSPLPDVMLPRVSGDDAPGASGPVPDGGDGTPVARGCVRYRADGSRCGATATHPDGWCRTPPCGGFRTSEAPAVRWVQRRPRVPGDADRDARLAAPAPPGAGVRVTGSAVRDFVAVHGGGAAEAEAEIRAVVPAFLEGARHACQSNGYWLLDLDGYRLVLSPGATAVTGYRSVHAERSHAQFEAGVPSRYRRPGGTGAVPGPAGAGAVRAVDTTVLMVSARARDLCVDHLPGLRGLAGNRLTDGIRRALASDLAHGHVQPGTGGPHLVIGRAVTWSLSPDARAITHVRRHTALDTEILAALALPPAELEEGTGLRVRTLAHIERNLWRVAAVPAAPGHRLVLEHRPGSPAPVPGSDADAWVTRTQCGLRILSTDDFGRRPLAERMVPRYEAALRVLPGLSGDASPEPSRLRPLAVLAAMAARCLNHDQPDWLHVWRLLGKPRPDRLGELRDLARETGEAVRSADASALERLPGRLDDSGWAVPLSEALTRLHQSRPAAGTPLAASRPAADPDAVENAGPNTGESGGPVAGESAVPRPDDARESPLLARLTASAEEDRQCFTHEAVRHELKAALLRERVPVGDSPLVDVSSTGADGPVLYEVLRAGHLSYDDIRAGAVRLREIAHVTGVGTGTGAGTGAGTDAARVYVVLPAPPAQEWAPGLVREVLGVSVLWRTAAGWAGGGDGQALGPGRGRDA